MLLQVDNRANSTAHPDRINNKAFQHEHSEVLPLRVHGHLRSCRELLCINLPNLEQRVHTRLWATVWEASVDHQQCAPQSSDRRGHHNRCYTLVSGGMSPSTQNNHCNALVLKCMGAHAVTVLQTC
jgi:hypothetical protein